MASKDPYPGNPLQPPAKIIDNPPQKSVSGALSNAKKQVSKAK
jgi:hypothetical protein